MVNKVSPRAGGGLTLLPRELTPLQQNFRLLEMLLLSRILRKFTGTFRIIYSEMRKEISHITHMPSQFTLTSENNQLLGNLSKGYMGLFSGKPSDGNRDWKAGFPQNFSHFSLSQAQSYSQSSQSHFESLSVTPAPLECYLLQHSASS